MTVYLDTLVLINTYASWLVLSLSSKLIHQSIPGKRLALSALAGGLSSLLILIPTGTVWQTILLYALKCISILIVLLTAFYKKGMSKRRFFSAIASFFGVNLLFSGGVYLVQSMLKTKIVYIKGVSYYFDISLTKLIFITAAVYIILSLISYISAQRLDKAHSYIVYIALSGQSYSLEGVADTGNTVRDIFSGKDVVICTGIAYPESLERRIIPVPFSTVNGEGVLYAVNPDKISIEDEHGSKTDVSALIAFTDGQLRRAVFNPKILM